VGSKTDNRVGEWEIDRHECAVGTSEEVEACPHPLPSPIGAGLVVFDWGFQPVAAAIPVAYALAALT
jgi:hypothetical protein